MASPIRLYASALVVASLTFAFQANARSDQEVKDRDRVERIERDVAKNRERELEQREKDQRDAEKREADRVRDLDKRAGEQSGSHGGSGSSSGSDGSGSGSGEVAAAQAPSTQQVAGQIIERDADGRERRSDEVLLVGRSETVEALQSQGFDVIGANSLSSSGEVIARVRVRGGESVETTLDRLRAVSPPGTVTAPNHVFRPSAADRLPRALKRTGAAAPARKDGASQGRLGIIDTGIDVEGSGLTGSVLATRSFTGATYTPREHGSAVAMIASKQGVLIDAADVFASDARGGIYATAEAAASAIDWLVERGAPVINISIQGPDNSVLEKVVRSALARGVVVVAAAGNQGPVAPPSYPAAYIGVVSVTAVDAEGRIYRRANRGDYISFAAYGVHVPVAGPQGPAGKPVTGTSYAAPSVAAQVALRLHTQSPEDSQRVLSELRARAVDLGPPGRDQTFGWGWLR
jgi:hypothetical protein